MAYVGGDSEAGSELRIVAIDGSRERVLYLNEEKDLIQDLEWSPDSQHVLATFYDTDGELSGLTNASVRLATVALADRSIKVLKTITPEENDIPDARWSPDGRYIAYERMMDTASEQEDIFLIPLDGGPETHLIENRADDDILGWTPDGRGLLFRRPGVGMTYGAWLIKIADGKPASAPRLVKTGLERLDLEGPVRTPTGSWTFYYRHREPGSYKLTSSVYTAALDPETGKLSTTPKRVTKRAAGRERALSPDFSRDGKYLAYYVASGVEQPPERIQSIHELRTRPGNIVVQSLETGQQRELTLSPKLNGAFLPYLRWSPDGRSLLVRGLDETGRDAIFRADANTGKLRPLVLNDAQPTRDLQLGWGAVSEGDAVGVGEWSSDGKKLFYIRTHFDPKAKGKRAGGKPKRTRTRILARDLETGQETEVYRDPKGVGGLFGFNVSPDGQSVAIHAHWPYATSLKIIPTGGGEFRELLQLQEPEGIPGTSVAWTPDGRYLLFVKVDQGRAVLWRISADGGQGERVGELPAAVGRYVEQLRVHPDGRRIAFHASRWVSQTRIRMMQLAFSPRWARETCVANLKTIGKAIERYKRDHDDVPDRLSDLYPEYLRDKGLLLCPSDERGGRYFGVFWNSKMPCSYRYWFNSNTWPETRAMRLPVATRPAVEGLTWKKVGALRLNYFAGSVPIVECMHHSPGINLSYDGEVYEAESWMSSPRARAGLLSRLKAAMQSNPNTWAQQYDLQRFLSLLGDPAPLVKLLETHIDEHPGNASAAARGFLAELPKLRFVTQSEDDAEESSDGNMYLDSSDLELIHDAQRQRGDQVIGIRFAEMRVPKGAMIKKVHLQFTVDGINTETTDLTIHAELCGSAEPFTEDDHNISARKRTKASVKWSPEPWTIVGERSEKQRTPDLSSLIREVVAQDNWKEGNAIVLIITGSGKRDAESHDGDPTAAPMLYVEYAP